MRETGAHGWRGDGHRLSGRITLLVEGDLNGKHVTDAARGYSEKLVGAQHARVSGWPHVHVVDADGFADLLDGIPARCRNLHGTGTSVRVAPEPGEGVHGGLLAPRQIATHDHVPELAWDLSKLDGGSRAHEETVQALFAHLASTGVTAQRPGRGSPRFDVGLGP